MKGIRPSVDGLCRDGAGQVARERALNESLTRRKITSRA